MAVTLFCALDSVTHITITFEKMAEEQLSRVDSKTSTPLNTLWGYAESTTSSQRLPAEIN